MEASDAALHSRIADRTLSSKDRRVAQRPVRDWEHENYPDDTEQYEHRPIPNDWETRRQKHVAGARRTANLSSSSTHHDKNRSLQHFVREPGGKFDSFSTLPLATEGADKVTSLVLYAHHQVYSNFFVGEANGTGVLPYTKYALQHEHAYWGAAWFTCTSRRWLNAQSMQHTPQEMVFYSKSLQALRIALSDPSLATHESTISTILHLSFPPYLPDFNKNAPHPRQSKFKTWNLLHLATGLNVAEEHMKGLSTIVNMLGGVQNIRSAQIRRSVCFQGIHFSGRHLKAPLFPFASLHPIEQLIDGSRLIRSRQALVMTRTQSEAETKRGVGFQNISFPEVHQSSLQPQAVWDYLGDMTTILENYAAGGSIPNDSSIILDQMQYTQHSLLSLPTAMSLKVDGTQGKDTASEDLQRWEVRLTIYEITRLACICFANLVTYPTDYSTFPRLRLTRLLMAQIQTLYNRGLAKRLTDQESKLVFWATVLGAIMAVGLEREREMYRASVAKSATNAKVRSWADAKEVMESFLWHSYTSDADALSLWVEIQKFERQNKDEGNLPEESLPEVR